MLCSGDKLERRYASLISGKDCKFNASENDSFGGVDILMASKFIQNTISVNKRLINIRILIHKFILNIFSVYAPHTGHSLEEKDLSYEHKLSELTLIPQNELLLIYGNVNCHVGIYANRFGYVHDNQGFGTPTQKAFFS